MKTYREKLRDPRWQRRRLEILSAAEFSCQACSDSESTLHVHHRRYIKGREPWEYDDQELVALCEDCHAIDHECDEMLQEALCATPFTLLDKVVVVSLVAGYLHEINEHQGAHGPREVLRSIGKTWGSYFAFDAGKYAQSMIVAMRKARFSSLNKPQELLVNENS
jgi:hypothetical protein